MDQPTEWREAVPDDVAELFRLVQAAYRGRGGWTSEAGLIEGERIGRAALSARVKGHDSTVMVVPGDGRLRACCEVRGGDPGPPRIAHFGLFAVDPAEQGMGVGGRLLTAARGLAAERLRADALEIHVVSGQDALLAWYERRGFTATGETIPFRGSAEDRPLVAGLHFVVMRCPTRPGAYALSWSGGKDSALALHVLAADRGARPAALLTTLSDEHDRISMHGVRRKLLLAQAAAAGVALAEVRIPADASNDVYERRLRDALDRPPLRAVEEIAFGDLFLADIRAYRETQCAAAGRRARFPLWRIDTAALARRFLALGFRARITCLDSARLDPALAGREYDARLLAELPADVDPCGENGEFHTFVYDGPVFRAPIRCRPGPVVQRDGFVFADLLSA